MKTVVVGSLYSPFVRKVRMFMLAHQIDFEFKVINYLENKDDERYLASINPINKIPVLLDAGQTIFDSRVIVRHLMQTRHIAPLTIEQENQLTAVDSLLDVEVNLLLLKRGGLDISQPNWYVQRQQERISSTLDYVNIWLDRYIEAPQTHWNFVAMSLLSYVDWCEFRKLRNFDGHDKLKQFAKNFGEMTGAAETKPR